MSVGVEMRNLYTGDSYGLEGIVYRSELEELGVVEEAASTPSASSHASLSNLSSFNLNIFSKTIQFLTQLMDNSNVLKIN